MNEITNNHFEYSLVSDETAMSLKSKKNQLDGIYFRYTSEVGQVLYEAQQELADYNNDGLFAKWVEAAGFKRQRAYEYINIYKYAVRITDNDELEIFEKQPKSIQTEMSKPSANPEINQAVFSGDITTHKEYKEREKEYQKQLKQQAEQHQRQLAEKDEVINKTYEQLEKAQQEPTVIKKEVVPADYENIKSDNQQLTEALKEAREREKRAIEAENKAREHYNQLLASRAETEENSQKYKQLSEAIHNAQNELTGKQKLISNYQNLSQLLRTSNEFLSKASAIVYQDLSEVVSQDGLAKRELTFLIERTERFLSDLRKQINNNNIIEGEIINE